ncbi:hypothetical protein GCM10009037_19640 [Halarchaeum grantii]|uniref:UDP-glucose 4-epimerase n=1 Tax=Halarchaeum grantii TaxID=1193105 RepID=A0A830EW94_9EURY|nr:hypothetical protein [Halarchaeum grantii]GGL36163.1 hypothetical protein GCM10009037_19640 [Halarchaeum grantii]
MQATLRAATTDYTGEAFNTGTGSSVSIRALAETMRDAADTESEIVHTDARDGDIEESIADISKAREQLGFEPQVALDDGHSLLPRVRATGEECDVVLPSERPRLVTSRRFTKWVRKTARWWTL